MFLPPSLPPARRIRSGGNKEEEEIKEIFLPQMVGGNSSTRTYYFRRCKRVRWSAVESIPDEVMDFSTRMNPRMLFSSLLEKMGGESTHISSITSIKNMTISGPVAMV
ncbi:hypothetical protein ACS0TY_034596 [Phlomoides rotata]